MIEQKQSRTRVVYRSSGTTNLLSLALNQNAAYWEMARVLVTQLSNAESLRTEVQLRSEANANQYETSPTLTNLRMARFLVQWTMRTLRHELMKRLFREQWSIVIQAKPDMPKSFSDHGFRIMRPPRDRFYADPFLIERNGRSYLFFEEYKFSSGKGLISCCEVDSVGNCSEPRVVLERPYHLSYPFLFSLQGEVYMIPETLCCTITINGGCLPQAYSITLCPRKHCACSSLTPLGDLGWPIRKTLSFPTCATPAPPVACISKTDN